MFKFNSLYNPSTSRPKLQKLLPQIIQYKSIQSQQKTLNIPLNNSLLSKKTNLIIQIKIHNHVDLIPFQCQLIESNIKEQVQIKYQDIIRIKTSEMYYQNDQQQQQYQFISIQSFLFNDDKRLTAIQKETIRYMNSKCQQQHNGMRNVLEQRVNKLGYNAEDLNKLQFYVQNIAPIIVHVHISKHMQFFINDTHYRNQFQTKKSSGTLSTQTRVVWENRIFDNKYTSASNFQRVKYGVINFTQDPKGVEACLNYGQSYFILKPHIRKRCTFTDKDSSYIDSSIGTLKFCFKILNKLTDNELKAVFIASKGQEVSSKSLVTYKQIQIHGPIQFSKDIEVLKVNFDEISKAKNAEMVQAFCKKFNIRCKYFSRNIQGY